MILNLEEFKNTRGEYYSFPFEIMNEIPEVMPKLVIDPFEDFFKQGLKDELSPTDILKVYQERDFQLVSEDMSKEFALKELYNSLGMYGFVSWRWLKPFIDWLGDKKCLEVMAGRGWLSKGLREKGVEVIATDNFSWHEQRNWDEPITAVEKLDAVQSVIKYGANVDIVIMSWPYMDNTAFQVLKKLHEINPNAYIVYIGEWDGGCTADEEFFDHYIIEDSDMEFYSKVAPHFESWHAIRDSLYLGKYKE